MITNSLAKKPLKLDFESDWKRIKFKILLLTFKALHGMAPRYIIDLINIKTNMR